MSTITVNDGTSDSTTPVAVEGYSADDAGRTIVHQLIGGGIAVSVIAPDPSAGTLALIYDDETDAEAARQLHRRAETFTLVSGDVPTVGMTYACLGVSRVLTPDVGMWAINVRFQEVP